MYIKYEQITVSTVVLDRDALDVPNKATHAEIQAAEQNVLYTLTGQPPDPTAGATGAGMVLPANGEPKLILIEDLKNINFVRGAGNDAKLNIHYLSGRDI